MSLTLIDEKEFTYTIGDFTSTSPEGAVQYWKDPERSLVRIVFNSPDTMNALPVASFVRVSELVRRADADEEVKVIVFAGVGTAFGVGAHVNELGRYIGYGEAGSKPPSQLRRMLPDREVIFGGTGYEQTIARSLKVTICEVQGYCYGAHYQFALASDIVVCSDDASFVHPAWRYLGPITNFAQLTDLIGLRKAKEMVLTARPLNAKEAEDYGFVTRRVEKPEDIGPIVNEYIEALSVMPLDGIAMGKSIFDIVMDARGFGIGEQLGVVGHTWMTNQRLREGEWNFLKARRDKGVRGAVQERDSLVPPYFRMGSTRESVME
ncbi:enoyl-CoA hydratase/isomerase family protein [Specibacter sp. RAF43]|uniref:enoyl-CoA hydratase/isomerase family protein n=1 Tax=Specibacter sp. RAF43 TaxID=3233057 RepID=UPI003F9E9876